MPYAMLSCFLSLYCIVIVFLNEINGDGDGDGEMHFCAIYDIGA